VEREQYEELVFRLVNIALDVKTFTEQQTQINERLTSAIERLDVTVQGIKDILNRGKGH
jgi:hypothetical protein